MAKLDAELPHERHNRLAYELGTKIYEELQKVEDRMLLIASIAKGIICLSTASTERRFKLAEILADEIRERLEEELRSIDGVEAALDVTDSYPIHMNTSGGVLVFRIARNGFVEFGPGFEGDATSRKFVDHLALMVGEKFRQEAQP